MSGCDAPRYHGSLQVDIACTTVEDSRKKRGVCDSKRPKTHYQAGPSNRGKRNIFGVREQPYSKRENKVQVNLSFREVQYLEEADSIPRRVMEGICSVPKRIVVTVSMLIVDNADRTLMPTSVALRKGTWLRTSH